MSFFVDSSVWIDFLRGTPTPKSAILADWLQKPTDIIVGDLVLAEVLRGCDSHDHANEVLRLMSFCRQVDVGGRTTVIKAAAYYRDLRSLGVTVRKTIDVLIATWCIREDVPLLHHDRDFDPFAQYLGLRIVSSDPDIGS